MHTRSTSRSPAASVRRTAIFAVIALLQLAGFAPKAQAQGTMGTVPDPISARELDIYGKRLRLSDQQRVAADSFHDQYKAEYAQLRDTDIEKYLKDAPEARGPRGMVTDRKAVEKSIKDLDSIVDRIKGIDNRLFDQIQTVLAEDQVALLQGVRLARERVRYRSGMTRMTSFMNPATNVDLTEILADIALTPTERETVDPLISQYESSLTAAARKLHEGGSRMQLEILDKLAGQGFTVESASDPQQRDQVFGAFRTVWGEINAKQQERAAVISDLNLKTQRSLAPVLTPEHARTLRSEFVEKAYPEANLGGSRTAKAFELALGYEELTDEQRQTITVMANEYHAAVDRITDQMVELIDTNRKTTNFFDFNRESRQKFDESINAIRDKRRTMAQSAQDTLKATLGPELTERLEKRVAGGSDEPAAGSLMVTIASSGGMISSSAVTVAVEGNQDETPVRDPYIPAAITRRNLDTYAAILGLADEDKVTLGSMHDDYLEKYEAFESSELKSIRDAEASLWSMGGRRNRQGDGGGGQQVNPPSAQAVNDLYAMRARALASIQSMDAAFFADVQAALLSKEQEPLMRRVIAARERDIYNRGGGNALMNFQGMGGGRGNRGGAGPAGPGGGGRGAPGGGMGGMGRAMRMFTGGGSEESGIDLADIIDEVRPPITDRTPIEPAVTEYETAMTAALRRKYETAVKLQLARDKMIAQMAQEGGGPAGGGGGRNFQAMGGGFRDLMDNQGKESREAAAVVTNLNRETIAKLIALLPAEAGANLRRAYNRRAFPDVYRDPRSAEIHLAAALNLPDLNEQQRSQIQEIAAEYRGAYDQLCEKLTELDANAPDLSAMFGGGGPGGGAPDFQAIQERARAREKVEFERNDLSDKATSRLKSLLNEQQVARLGGLAINPDVSD